MTSCDAGTVYALNILQGIFHKVAGKTEVLRPFAADEVEIAGDLQVLDRHLHQVAFSQLAYDGWPRHKAKALIGQ